MHCRCYRQQDTHHSAQCCCCCLLQVSVESQQQQLDDADTTIKKLKAHIRELETTQFETNLRKSLSQKDCAGVPNRCELVCYFACCV